MNLAFSTPPLRCFKDKAPLPRAGRFVILTGLLHGHVAKLVNAGVCKTFMRRFESGRGLQNTLKKFGVFCLE